MIVKGLIKNNHPRKSLSNKQISYKSGVNPIERDLSKASKVNQIIAEIESKTMRNSLDVSKRSSVDKSMAEQRIKPGNTSVKQKL
jgi:hypothetical protein